MTPFLQITNLTRTYDDVDAVKDVTFHVEVGEFVALLGPSGCGKSTTLKMIAGLERPTHGRIEINGENVIDRTPGKRNLSMVFQSYALFPHMSVRENIVFGLKARKVPGAEQKARLEQAIEMVDLAPHLKKKPSQLSGGQCQRVALARTIVSNAPLCLMDEPLSNLDTKLRADMRTEIRALQKQLGLTVIYVTHDQIEAMSMADRIILINNGSIEQVAAPEVFYEKPETAFVAGFIGHPPMNLFARQDVEVGVRPEHVELVENNADGIEATVIECDYQGSETILSTASQGSIIKVCLPGKRSMPTGTMVKIRWDRKFEHHFSKSTGHRMTAQNSVMKFQ